MKLMVTGIGGVGGYLASFLNTYYPGQVTLIARKARKESLAAKGLVLHSEYFGEHVTHPAVTDTPANAGIQDVIFVCVKNYSLEAALKAVIPCIGADTIVFLIQNGIDHAEKAREIVPQGHIIDAAVSVNSQYNDDFSIEQSGKFARIFFGSDDADSCRRVEEILAHEGLRIHNEGAAIGTQIWIKYITNCAFNVITAYYEETIGAIFARPDGKEQFHTLLEEATNVGRATGIALPEDLVETIYGRVIAQKNKDVYSSLANDIMAGRKSELDTFSGLLVRTAEKVHVAVPLSAMMYHAIAKRIAERQQQ